MKKTMTGERFMQLMSRRQCIRDKDPVVPPAATDEEVEMLTDEVSRLRSLVRKLAFASAQVYVRQINDTRIAPMPADTVTTEFFNAAAYKSPT